MARRSTVNMALAVAIAASTLVAPVDAIVRRHDVPDARYVIPDDYFPPLADIPIEGQGVLIAPTWVITAAHATQWQRKPIDHVMIAGKSRNVSQVIVHPGWKRVPQSEVGSEASRLATRLDNDDVALLRLSEPVTDVTPASIYRGEGEVGHIVEIIGKGQTGTGKDGIADDATHRTVLHRAQNRIESANGHWLTYRFDTGSRALPIEGIFGGGDSGGPIVMRDHGGWKLIGLTSWGWSGGHIAIGDAAGRYGETAYIVRLSRYADWIDEIIASKGN